MAMAAFAPVLKQLMLDGIMSSPAMPRLPRVSPAGIFFLWFSALLIVMSLGFVLYAEFIYLSATYTAEIAALGVACTSLAVALLSAAVGMLMMSRRQVRRPVHHVGPQPDIAKTITGMIDSLATELEDPIRENPKTAIMIASLAGFLAGDSRH